MILERVFFFLLKNCTPALRSWPSYENIESTQHIPEEIHYKYIDSTQWDLFPDFSTGKNVGKTKITNL